MKKIAAVLAVSFLASGVLFASPDMKKREKLIRCEQYCTMKYDQCVERVFSLKGKAGDRGRVICQSHLASCMGRCGQYRD